MASMSSAERSTSAVPLSYRVYFEEKTIEWGGREEGWDEKCDACHCVQSHQGEKIGEKVFLISRREEIPLANGRQEIIRRLILEKFCDLGKWATLSGLPSVQRSSEKFCKILNQLAADPNPSPFQEPVPERTTATFSSSEEHLIVDCARIVSVRYSPQVVGQKRFFCPLSGEDSIFAGPSDREFLQKILYAQFSELSRWEILSRLSSTPASIEALTQDLCNSLPPTAFLNFRLITTTVSWSLRPDQVRCSEWGRSRVFNFPEKTVGTLLKKPDLKRELTLRIQSLPWEQLSQIPERQDSPEGFRRYLESPDSSDHKE